MSVYTSNSDYSLLAPGPVNLHPRIREIMAEPMIHHRTPEYDQIFKRSLENLKSIFQTKNAVYIHPSTGSGGMESLVVNTLSPGDEVLVIVSGKFGERWAEMTEVYGMKTHRMNIPWGEALSIAQLETFLQQHPKTQAVLCQACETSTAVLHPIEAMGQVIANYPSTLFLVDGITALGALPLPMDAFRIDGLVGGSQKAFMLPTGLSFVSFSEKAWKKIETSKTPKYYFDIKREQKANKKGESFFSGPVPLMKALDWVLQYVLSYGLRKHFEIIRSRAAATREFYQSVGLSLYSKFPSESLTAICAPTAIDGQKWRLLLEQKHNITVMGGQDQLKGKILRIGHMGYITPKEMKRLFMASVDVLNELAPGSIAKTQAEIETLATRCAEKILEVP